MAEEAVIFNRHKYVPSGLDGHGPCGARSEYAGKSAPDYAKCGMPEFSQEFHTTLEMVEHPAHYGGADDPHEHVKCATAWGLVDNAFLYNATKYICRAGRKGDALTDLKKARWYVERAVQELEGRG